MYKTILFDWDGTLLDSNQLINESNMYALNKYGNRTFTEDDVKPFNGPPLMSVYEKLYPEFADQILSAYRSYNDTHHDEVVNLFPEVEQTLRKLKKSKYSLGIVSMKRRHMVERGVALFGLLDVFDVIIGGDECVNKKPHAEPILKAMERLGARKKETLMLGDNWQDIESANNAEIDSVFVTWSQKPYEVVAPYQPTYCIDKMNELVKIIERKNVSK